MGASAEILWEADRKGLRIAEVPIEVDYSKDKTSRGPIDHGMSVIGSMVRYLETKHALLFFSLPGFFLVLGGVLLGLYVADIYHRTAQLAVGLSLLTVTLVQIGLMLGFTGLILHAVINATNRLERTPP